MDKDWKRGSKFMNDDVKIVKELGVGKDGYSQGCLLYTSPSPRDGLLSRMPSSA